MRATLSQTKGVEIVNFPDGQLHVRVTGVREGDEADVLWALRNPDELFLLMAVADALDGLFVQKRTLTVPFLTAGRSDRRMLPGDSCDLKVVSRCINACGFQRVILFDVHSDVALQLIDRSTNRDNRELLWRYQKQDAVLIVPDAGGIKRADGYMAIHGGFKQVVQCTKVRDLRTGRITLRVLEPERCYGRDCIIVDDLCDGGSTFVEIAKQIEPRHLALVISHGIFSRGFELLDQHFDEIIVSDSYRSDFDSKKVTVVKLFS